MADGVLVIYGVSPDCSIDPAQRALVLRDVREALSFMEEGTRLRSHARTSKMDGMNRALKAHVKGGRLLLDEPTDLPDGAEVRVALVDDDELDDTERAKLHAAILDAEAELDAGKGVGEGELWTRLRAIR
ncbi:MAG: hypothetical protein WCC48_17045 [Anaeromyxobacteraceae bacterium]